MQLVVRSTTMTDDRQLPLTADHVLRAIEDDDRFYVFPNPGSQQRIEQRVSRIMKSFES